MKDLRKILWEFKNKSVYLHHKTISKQNYSEVIESKYYTEDG